jgi:guanylate kinase
MIFCILGASNSGKTELMREFVKEGCHEIKSTTDRPRRSGESEDTYRFVTPAEFKRKLDNADFIEHAKYGGYNYAIEDEEVWHSCTNITIMTPQGLKQIRELYTDDIFSILLEVPEDERRRRGLSRGDDPETLERRIVEDRDIFGPQLRDKVDLTIYCPKREVYPVLTSLMGNWPVDLD